MESWSKFYRDLYQAASTLELPTGCDSTIYSGTQSFDELEYRQRLLDDVQSNLVAGLIFTGAPFALRKTPALEQQGIPRVGVMEPADYILFPVIYPDFEAWYELAFKLIAQSGRRRIAALLAASVARTGDSLVARHAASFGLTVPRQWIRYLDPQTTSAAQLVQRNVELLFSTPADHRPQVLLVTDDNLLAPAIEGLVAAGLQAGRDVTVVTHCNFPEPEPVGIPLTRGGLTATRTKTLAGCSRQGASVPNRSSDSRETTPLFGGFPT